ncbi:hypothetical protein, variant [Aphanomyces invadans]|uniref:Uncharacterized protein n=1 Tax=Aphanomyces invadans TaxID=157072 RepID=A0A024TYU4_9STRA|nr:hypothetical protein H310_07981 [Aphanomyces invadans]XP_008871744.1 hypothetical protein, variant [Aphanomyces invadans]ETV99187.1 hypothetical protein H310_07981 [Aphanomyces invadans]ETV99188.1 hypothetical protein, variant [Aphanomyces invadans]|eukprot:XP_008871743.1 hypothetical protein H310_07981 [Aphanomyces invadans]
MGRDGVIVVLLACTTVAAGSVDTTNMICKASGISVGNISDKSPMSFCIEHQYPRCCVPVQEAQIITFYTTLLDTGVSCMLDVTNPGHVPLKQIFCAPCSPLAPMFLSPPQNTAFFTSASTFKICRSLAGRLTPALFDHCGFAYVDRVGFCTPKRAIAPGSFFMSCNEGEHVCFRQNETRWYCGAHSCGLDVPVGLANLPCSNETCTGVFKFLNDNRGAKPPFYEDTAVEIVDEKEWPYCLGMQNPRTVMDEL